MKTLTHTLTCLVLAGGLCTAASASQLPNAAPTSMTAPVMDQLAESASSPATIELAANTFNSNSNRSYGRSGRRSVRGVTGPRRSYAGRRNRTSNRNYNSLRRARIQQWISRHRRHI